VTGDYAYVASGSARLLVYRVADPTTPIEVGRCGTSGEANCVAVSGGHAYVAASYSGLRVDSVADPARPGEAGHYSTGRKANGVTVVGDYAYVACGDAGLQILQFYGLGVEETPNAEVRTANPMPTIVRGVLVLDELGTRSELPERNSVMSRAALLDASGRKVMDLRTGVNDVTHLAPGIYFVRSEPSAVGRQPSAVIKVVIAR
jgi:hypothetical protein